MNNIICDNCHHSEYAGYSCILNSNEFCLLFNKQLELDKENNTIPCKECEGKCFKFDE